MSVQSICSQCGNPIVRYVSVFNRFKNHFCSMECKGQFYKNKKTWNYGIKTGKVTEERRLKIAEGLFASSSKKRKINRNILDDDVIIGLLLSDAHINRPYTQFQNSFFSISISSKYKTFPSYIESYLRELGISVNKKEYVRKTGVIHWNVKTVVDPQFSQLRKIWYPNGNKIVPRNLKLTPKIISFWFQGDGSSGYYKRGNKKVVLVLMTQGFNLNDVLFLKHQLELLDVKMNINRVKRKSVGYILITKVSFEVEKFMKMVEPYVLPDFMYKVKHPYVNSKSGAIQLWMTDSNRHKCEIIDCTKTAEKGKAKCHYHNHHVLAVV